MRLSSLALATSLFTLTAAAYADSFLYTFSDPKTHDSFTYDSPTLITRGTDFSTPFCSLVGGVCTGVTIDPLGSITIANLKHAGSGYYDLYAGLPSDFFTPGTHFDASSDDTLTVTEVAGFLYTFSAPALKDSFTYTSPTLITSSTAFTASSCIFEGGACNATAIDPAGTIEVGYFRHPGSGAYDLTASLPTSFFLPGINFNAANNATLTVTPILPTATTPEPSSLVLLGSGLLGALGVLRRKLPA